MTDDGEAMADADFKSGPVVSAMNFTTLLRYLSGSRRAIEAIAASPKAVWLGALFVLSAGFAREYDGVDLLHEPWHVVVPLAASLATSFVLFFLAMAAFRPRRQERQHGPGFWRSYWSFLGLYWLTAPLAWLYAIPVERFLSPVAAVEANLCLLALVSVWRVVLMTRVVAVVFDAKPVAAFFVVMFFADSVAVVALMWEALHVVRGMSGARMTQAEGTLVDWTRTVFFWGVMSWLLWLVGAIVVAFRRFYVEWKPRVPAVRGATVGWSLWALAVAALAVWVFVLPITQPGLRLSREMEALIRSDRLVEALRVMSRHERTDYPPLWNPPPQPEHGDRAPGALKIVEGLVESGAAPWVREMYLEKLDRVFESGSAMRYVAEELGPDGYPRFIHLIEQLPEGTAFLDRHQETMRYLKWITDSLSMGTLNFDVLFVIRRFATLKIRCSPPSFQGVRLRLNQCGPSASSAARAAPCPVPPRCPARRSRRRAACRQGQGQAPSPDGRGRRRRIASTGRCRPGR